MKKGQIIEGIVQWVDFPNKGIVETEEGICVVKNALPGQRVQCAVNKVRKGRAEGRLLKVLETSSLECGSPCPHFGSCGGCTFLSLPYEEQLKIKEEQVKKLLDSVLDRQGPWQFEGIKESPVCFGYRNKMEFSFGDEIKDGPLALGMHKRGSFYDIVSVTGCRIVDEDYRRILCCVKAYFTQLQEQGVDISFYHRLRHIGYLRHLLVRKASKTGEILVALVTTTQGPGERKTQGSSMSAGQPAEDEILFGLRDSLLALELDGKMTGILHIRNDAVADVIQSDETRILYGQDYFYEELLGLRFRISVFSFFQTNSCGAEVLYQTARDYITEFMDFVDPVISVDAAECLGGAENEQNGTGGAADSVDEVTPRGKIVFDLYSGTGTIAQLMAPVARKVIGVEIVEEAVEAARKNARMNGLDNCEFIAGDVLKVLDEIKERPDFIILDPPRDGVHPKALRKIIDYGVDRMIYISCKPTSLVRDLEILLENGYEVERATAVDQFPWTGNVETVALLSLKNDTPKIEVTMEVTADSNYRPKEKATYQNIKKYVKDNFGVNVHTRYIAEVKRMCGLEMGENHHKSQKENPEIKHCPPAKMMYIEDALKYFGLI